MDILGLKERFYRWREMRSLDKDPDYPCPGCGQPGVRYPAVCMKCKLVGEYIVSTTTKLKHK